jgi:putative ABC transport system permease protein
VLQRVAQLPGVVAAGYTTAAPLQRKGGANGLTLEGHEADPNASYNANQRQISPDYFKAIGLALHAGRLFNEHDAERSQPVAIVNETMARAFWPGENALGKRFKVGNPKDSNPWLTVVGVVADVRQMAADEPVKAEMYLPYTQGAAFAGFFAPRDLIVRTAGDPAALAASVRQAVHEVDPYEPVANVRTMSEVLSRATTQAELGMTLLTTFAALALLLAALGIYGVLSYFVIQHTPEIGVRLALGAQERDVLRLVIMKGMRLALLGVVIGLAGAFALTRLLQSLLFEVKANDPLTFIVIALLLTFVALVACWIPARRATRVDPIVALRYE